MVNKQAEALWTSPIVSGRMGGEEDGREDDRLTTDVVTTIVEIGLERSFPALIENWICMARLAWWFRWPVDAAARGCE